MNLYKMLADLWISLLYDVENKICFWRDSNVLILKCYKSSLDVNSLKQPHIISKVTNQMVLIPVLVSPYIYLLFAVTFTTFIYYMKMYTIKQVHELYVLDTNGNIKGSTGVSINKRLLHTQSSGCINSYWSKVKIIEVLIRSKVT